MDKRAIGIFDSGVGGLTALKAINEIMPNEDIVYLGDTKNVPYGEKSREEVIECAYSNINFLKSKDVKVILAACGTISSQLKYIECDIPIFGIIEAACKKAVLSSKSGNIGVLATSRTIRSGTYKRVCLEISSDVNVREYACPKLAALIENGHIDCTDKELTDVLSEYLREVNESNIDVLILGCTHYAIAEDAIRSLLTNKDIILVNSGEEAAGCLKGFMEEHGLYKDDRNICGKREYFVSGNVDDFVKVASDYLGFNMKDKVFSIT